MKKRVTSFDVAERAGVSRSIVSAVINGTKGIGVSEEKRRIVLEAIKDLNYQVDANARGMRTGRSRCLAAYDNFESKFFLPILQGLKNVCTKEGYYILLYDSGDAEKDREGLVEMYLQRRIDGIITKDSTSFVDSDWAHEIHSRGVPYISVEGYPENNQVPSILMDYAGSIVMALDYLQERGTPPPLYIEMYTGPAYSPNWGDRQRRTSYENWMSIRGHKPQVVSVQDDSWEQCGARWVEWLRAQTLPITLLTNWSRGSINIYKAAYQLGLRVGKDLFVMAADNTEQVNEHLIPSLTAVEVPYEKMGELAAERMLEYIEGSRKLSDTSSITVSPKLMHREST
ncbi:LacI family transcriptional regulator [Paenibacillus hemerocallicola]|uniref:LacI family transcriptional regulator n=1 Tax=Paenibacillus hemerocallicola TaxID=1172614 RepID=A0A5C4TG40_9BACL|nr:LacI family DNA-binding transcriptional regulator [Paenibacillus hemerocallicola]TNJ67762.1 LacI family transcriptional regulator [Paenibacillus hemerocallicola]